MTKFFVFCKLKTEVLLKKKKLFKDNLMYKRGK